MRFFFAISLALLASVAICGAEDDSENVIGSNFYSELMREIQKQQKSMAGKGIREMATEFFDNVQSLGRELTAFMRDAVAQARGGQVSDSSSNKADKDKTIVELLAEMLAIQQQGDNGNQTETSRHKRETGKENSDISALLTQLMQGFQSGAKKDGGDSESTDGNSDSSNQQAEGEQQETNGEDGESQQQQEDASSVSGSAQTRIGNPAPVILIPGPPGKPGLPGPPGLPGKPGKIPNFRGLKAILTTRVAELLAFLALIFVLMIAKFLGLLGLLLGLVLPIYGKLKRGGVLVPGEEKGYGEPAPSYGAPAPAYGPPPSDAYAGRRKRAIPMQFPYPLNGLAERVHSGIDAAQQKF